MEKSDIERAPSPDHPRRCQAVNARGQCNNLASEGSSYCAAHGGNKAREAAAKATRYQNSVLGTKILLLTQDPEYKSLKDEVALLRALLQTVLESIHDAGDIIIHSGMIADLVSRVERTVVSCHKLDQSLGSTLDRGAILKFAGMIVDILSSELADTEQLNRIAAKIANIIPELNNDEDGPDTQ